jgi:lysophospholipase L1-like esterase
MLSVTALAVSCAQAQPPGPPPASGACGGPHWVASWGAAQSDAAIGFDATFAPLPASYEHRTIRNVISPHLAGSRIRVHVTNRYNTAPVTFGRVTVGVSDANGAVKRPQALSFDGDTAVTLAPGQDAVSDPMNLTVSAFTPLAVSIYVDAAPGQITKHWNSNATTYITPAGSGDATATVSGTGFTERVESWLGVLALDVEATGNARSIVALGDSLTDGFVAANALSGLDTSVSNTNARYPDLLQRRIAAAGLPVSMINAGLGSNQITGSIFPIAGPSAIDRFTVDVSYFATARGVIIFEGINDLGLSQASAPAIIDGLSQLVARARAAKLKVWLATITPASDAIVDGTLIAPNSERDRQTINKWIRTQTVADGYFDFDAAVRNPTHPAVLDDRFSSVDRLHLSPAGYEQLAATVDLQKLATTTC